MLMKIPISPARYAKGNASFHECIFFVVFYFKIALSTLHRFITYFHSFCTVRIESAVGINHPPARVTFSYGVFYIVPMLANWQHVQN